jgi:hypothetical protein
VDAKEIGCEGMDCTRLAEDKDQWRRAFVNTLMNPSDSMQW